jgi:hypothetical protein
MPGIGSSIEPVHSYRDIRNFLNGFPRKSPRKRYEVERTGHTVTAALAVGQMPRVDTLGLTLGEIMTKRKKGACSASQYFACVRKTVSDCS